MAENVIEVDLANERVVLASAIRDRPSRRRLANDVGEEDFGDARHRVAYRGLVEMERRNLEWNEDTFASLVPIAEAGGWTYVRKLIEIYEPNQNLDHHVERLRVDAVKLQVLKKHLPEISEVAADPGSSPTQLMSHVRAMGARIERSTRSPTRGGRPLVDGYYATLRARRAVQGIFYGTGFPQLDSKLTLALAPGRLSVIAARPGFGKSTLASAILRHRVSARQGAYLGCYEMEREDYLDAMGAADTGISITRLTKEIETLTDDERARYAEAIERYSDAGLIEIEENPFIGLPKLEDRWADVNERNLDHFESIVSGTCDTKSLYMIDVFFKLLVDRRPDKVQNAVIRLGQIAKRYRVHISLLHHLNREGAEGRPTLEHLKGSGSLEEEPDLILGLDRPILRASAARRRRMHDHLDVYVLKQRKGPFPLWYRYRFDGATASVSDEETMDMSMADRDEATDGDPT